MLKTRKRKAKSLSQLKKQAWGLLSEIVRRKYADAFGYAYCYTHPTPMLWHWKQLQAGHAIPGRTGAVLLDEEILRCQCPQCNVFRGGMLHVFATRLINDKGMEWWEKKLVESNQIKKWNRAELEETIAGYKARLAELS